MQLCLSGLKKTAITSHIGNKLEKNILSYIAFYLLNSITKEKTTIEILTIEKNSLEHLI